jgi:hypothetical protein
VADAVTLREGNQGVVTVKPGKLRPVVGEVRPQSLERPHRDPVSALGGFFYG